MTEIKGQMSPGLETAKVGLTDVAENLTDAGGDRKDVASSASTKVKEAAIAAVLEGERAAHDIGDVARNAARNVRAAAKEVAHDLRSATKRAAHAVGDAIKAAAGDADQNAE